MPIVSLSYTMTFFIVTLFVILDEGSENTRMETKGGGEFPISL